MYSVVFGTAASTPTFDYPGNMRIRTRIANIHGAYNKSDYYGKQGGSKALSTRVEDKDLPEYLCLQTPELTTVKPGERLALLPTSDSKEDFLIIGKTGADENSQYSDKKG